MPLIEKPRRAIQFRTSYDVDRDKVTTTSYGMTDSYNLAGNVITQNYKRTGEVVKYRIRVYETKYDKIRGIRNSISCPSSMPIAAR